MSDNLIAVIIGIVEGLTEYLPVSSTGHMIIVGHAIGFDGAQADTFEIFIQLGAVLAVVVLYFKDFISLARTISPAQRNTENKLSLFHIAVAIIPVMTIGFLLHHSIKKFLFGPQIVAIGLILGSVLMLFAEWRKEGPKKSDLSELTLLDSFYIGLFQCLALLPGVSRSGATIVGGLLLGYERGIATKFSFFLAVPVLGMAAFYDLYKNLSILKSDDFLFFTIGLVVAFLVALLTLKLLLGFVRRFTLKFFAYYRICLAILVIWYFA